MSYNQRSATSKNQISKPKPGKKPGKKDFMLNGIHERGSGSSKILGLLTMEILGNRI